MTRTACGRYLCFFLAAGFLFACGGNDQVKDVSDAAGAEHVFFSPPDVVVKAVEQALADYAFSVTSRRSLGPNQWELKVKKGPGNTTDQDVTRVLVQGQASRQALVSIMWDRSFFSRFTSEPPWTKSFFSHVFEIIP
jgi:hypothetical protein